MNALDILDSPWAIIPEKLNAIRDVYFARLEGRETDWLAAHRASQEALVPGGGRSGREERYEVIDGVAVVPLDGVIAQRMNMFSAISGGTSSQMFADAVRAAAADPLVEGIVLRVDSPGGSVTGTPEAAAAVKAVRGVKPIEAWTDGQMASAAYWIGSAAEAIHISSSVTQVGSIGVVMTHKDLSGAEEQRGVKTTEIYAGKYKRIASAYGPLSDAGRSDMQDKVDYLYSVFVGQVSDNRAASIENVLTKMADGRLFIGAQAVEAGLVDSVASLGDVIERVRNRAAQGRQKTTRESYMTKLSAQEIREQHAEAAAELEKAGATAERARIAAIQSAALPGHDQLVSALIGSGASAGDAAMQILAAEKQKVTAAGNARQSDAVAPVKSATPSAETIEELTRDQKADKAKAYARENKVEFVSAYQTLFPGER